jgi:hypothetical protein
MFKTVPPGEAPVGLKAFVEFTSVFCTVVFSVVDDPPKSPIIQKRSRYQAAATATKIQMAALSVVELSVELVVVDERGLGLAGGVSLPL